MSTDDDKTTFFKIPPKVEAAPHVNASQPHPPYSTPRAPNDSAPGQFTGANAHEYRPNVPPPTPAQPHQHSGMPSNQRMPPNARAHYGTNSVSQQSKVDKTIRIPKSNNDDVLRVVHLFGGLILGLAVIFMSLLFIKSDIMSLWSMADKRMPDFSFSLDKLKKKAPEEEVVIEYPEITEPIPKSDLRYLPDNTHHTLNNNMRSAKIRSKAELKYLKDNYGITTVVNLALDSTYDQQCEEKKKNPKVICEKYWAKSLKLEWVYHPLTNKGPDDAGWNKIKEKMLKGNALIHCTHGADRTGAVIGRFRLEEQQWERDEIYEEALKYGFKRKDFRYPGGKLDPNVYLREWMLDEM